MVQRSSKTKPMKRTPLVSVIVPTYNSAQVLEKCLESIKQQSYAAIELIVVDNNSRDETKAIARSFTEQVYTKAPERSAQRNYGVQMAKGEFVLIIDSDMELTSDVVSACVEKMQSTNSVGAIIPEESFGIGFWAQCKKLERSFYVGVDWIESARFFTREVYLRAGGYDESMVSGEDWDLSRRVQQLGPITRIDEYIMHNEGALKLTRTLRKKYYYAQRISQYMDKAKGSSELSSQTSIAQRYLIFFRDPKKMLRNPLISAGMLYMKTMEFFVGGLGYTLTRKKI